MDACLQACCTGAGIFREAQRKKRSQKTENDALCRCAIERSRLEQIIRPHAFEQCHYAVGRVPCSDLGFREIDLLRNAFEGGQYRAPHPVVARVRIAANPGAIARFAAEYGSPEWRWPIRSPISSRFAPGKSRSGCCRAPSLSGADICCGFFVEAILGFNGVLKPAPMGLGSIDEPVSFLLFTQFAVVPMLAHAWAEIAILPLYVSPQKVDRCCWRPQPACAVSCGSPCRCRFRASSLRRRCR